MRADAPTFHQSDFPTDDALLFSQHGTYTARNPVGWMHHAQSGTGSMSHA